MGSSQAKNLDMHRVSAHKLEAGDHIVNNTILSKNHAIFIDKVKLTCIYVDPSSKIIVESHVSNFCPKPQNLRKYDYSNVQCVDAEQIVLNAQTFLSRGYFSRCCMSSNFSFVYKCRTQRYTSDDALAFCVAVATPSEAMAGGAGFSAIDEIIQEANPLQSWPEPAQITRRARRRRTVMNDSPRNAPVLAPMRGLEPIGSTSRDPSINVSCMAAIGMDLEETSESQSESEEYSMSLTDAFVDVLGESSPEDNMSIASEEQDSLSEITPSPSVSTIILK